MDMDHIMTWATDIAKGEQEELCMLPNTASKCTAFLSQESLPSILYSDGNKTNQTYINKKAKPHSLFFLICSLFIMNPKYSGVKMASLSQFWCTPKSQEGNFAYVE